MDSHYQQSSTDLITSLHNLKHLFTERLHMSDEMTKILTQTVVSNYNGQVLLRRALGLHGAKMPNGTVSTSKHVK